MEELGRIWKNWVKFGEIRKTLEKLGRIGKSWEELGKIGKNIFDDEQTRIYRQKITCMYSVYQPQKCKKKVNKCVYTETTTVFGNSISKDSYTYNVCINCRTSIRVKKIASYREKYRKSNSVLITLVYRYKNQTENPILHFRCNVYVFYNCMLCKFPFPHREKKEK